MCFRYQCSVQIKARILEPAADDCVKATLGTLNLLPYIDDGLKFYMKWPEKKESKT